MLLSIEGKISTFSQFITVFLLFLFVVAITFVTTRYIAGYQKNLIRTGNMELLEGLRISGNKYLQIVRAGRRYLVVAVCKDTVTLLAELGEDELVAFEENGEMELKFKRILEKARYLHSQKSGRDRDKGK